MRSRTPETEEHGIDLAPMLDFTINLLIFFIVTTSFVKQPGVKVVEPSAQTAQLEQSGNLLIAIRENGAIWMNNKRVALRDIRSEIEKEHMERPSDTVVIIADRDAAAGMVAKVMDQVKLGGINDIAIGAKPES